MRQSTACQQCGRAIAPDTSGAGTCASCGWVLAPTTATIPRVPDAGGITDASTRALPPVAPTPGAPAPIAPDAPVVAATPLSSLPSGFTSMETQPVQPVADEDSATRPLHPEPPLPAPPQTAALPAMAVLPPSPPSSGGESRGRTWGMIAVVLLLLAIVVVAALVANGTLALGGTTNTPTAQSTPTPTPMPTTPAGFKPYVAPGAYQLNIPATWAAVPFQSGPTGTGQVTATGNIFEDVSNHNQLAIMVFSGTTLPSPQMADDQALSQLSAGKPMQNRQPADSVTLAGQSWTHEMADLPVNGQQSHVIVMATTRGAQLYLIFYLAPVNGYEVASVEDFQPMLNSFAFAS